MDLLPKSSSEFQSVDYWDKFFKKRGGAAFEWYGEYGDLCGILHKYSKCTDDVLMVGCGNSVLSEDLYDVGYHQLVNIDISTVVIKHMTTKNAEKRPKMKFIEMDVQKMTFENEYFNVVMDKGTLDAIMPDSKPATVESVQNMFAEIDRVMKYGGRYICISLAQQHIAKELVTWFTSKSWLVRVHKVIRESGSEKKSDFALPVFVFVCTKFKPIIASKVPLPLDVFFTKNSSNLRLESAEAVVAAIKAQQDYHVLSHALQTRSVDEEQLSFQLFNANKPTPRFTLYVVDRKSVATPSNLFAVFIVPQGREVEWLFSNPKGRLQLAESAGFKRLVVVLLHRDNQYDSLQSIQDELSGNIMELSPPDLPGNTKVPFLSIGNDIGKRTIVESGTSELSGDFVVEDVEVQGEDPVRRLIFMKTQHHIQTESKLKTVSVRGKGGKRTSKLVVDRNYVSFENHKGIIAGLALIPNFDRVIQSAWKFLLIGLGGGSLPVVLHSMFQTVDLDVVELDPAIIKVAKERFGVVPDKRLKLLEGDGIKFIEDRSAVGGNLYDVICFEVDSKDTSIGMTCPPKEFLEKSLLLKVKTLLKPKGLFALVFGCREDNLKASSLAKIKEVFPAMIMKPIEGEVNCVVYASCNTDENIWKETQKEHLPPAVRLLQSKVKKLSSDEFDVAEMFSEMRIE